MASVPAAEVTPISEIGPHRFTPSTISETLMNDDMKEAYPRSPPDRILHAIG
ncbi:hypothetical protein [Rhizobium leguminosarum]|uniref:Uncharacterized protein n=1 Tax=Rhizobium leguminosarum TaxID=384 RepID=A0A7W9ZZH1_RHILE|nr:hypothetical protein [Rhizobium leguminosarum]MBB6224464.1 hypothetical protein [Rhizobium leguminosarum]